MMVSR